MFSSWLSAHGGKKASCQVTVDRESVDLGLPSGLKWATMNVGASSPEEYGDYFAWGETEPHYSSLNPLAWKTGKENGYDWSSYKWCNGSEITLTKYNGTSGQALIQAFCRYFTERDRSRCRPRDCSGGYA